MLKHYHRDRRFVMILLPLTLSVSSCMGAYTSVFWRACWLKFFTLKDVLCLRALYQHTTMQHGVLFIGDRERGLIVFVGVPRR